jgi:hypothetical protein
MTKKKAEARGWTFLSSKDFHQAERPLEDGQIVRQQNLSSEGLLTAIEYFEDLQDRQDLSEPVTFDSEPASGINEQNKVTDPQPTADEQLQTP